MYLCLNKLAIKVWKKNRPNFLYTMAESWKKVRVIFRFIFGRFSFVSNVTNFFIHFLNRSVFFKKKCLSVAGFLQLDVLYANIRHGPRSEYNQWKSERSDCQRRWGVTGVFWDHREGRGGGVRVRSALRKFLDSKEDLDWLEIDLNVAEIITAQYCKHKKT